MHPVVYRLWISIECCSIQRHNPAPLVQLDRQLKSSEIPWNLSLIVIPRELNTLAICRPAKYQLAAL